MVNELGEFVNESGKIVTIKLLDNFDSVIPVLQKSKNIINISAFGAKGEGETDDTEAINKAIDYIVNRGGKLLFKYVYY